MQYLLLHNTAQEVTARSLTKIPLDMNKEHVKENTVNKRHFR
jgi:hypothetical protein